MKKVIFGRALGAFDRTNLQAECAETEQPIPELPSSMMSEKRQKLVTFEKLRMFVSAAPTVPIQNSVLDAIQLNIRKFASNKDFKPLIAQLLQEVTRQYEQSMKRTNGTVTLLPIAWLRAFQKYFLIIFWIK